MSERIFYLSELFDFLRKRKKDLLHASLLCFLVSFFLALYFQQPQFSAEATFRQIPSQIHQKNALQSVFDAVWNKSDEAYAISIMQSKKLLGKVISEMGLQIQEKDKNIFLPLLAREFGIGCQQMPFQFRAVSYDGEGHEQFFIRPLASDRFEVFDHKKKKIAEGKLGEPISLEKGSFSLLEMPAKKRMVAFQILSQRAVIPTLQKNLKIKKSRQDSNLLELKVKAKNRETAKGILNAVMQKFQQHLQEEHETLARQQIRYLKRRQADLEKDFEQTLEHHVAYLQSALGVEGFLGLAQELEILTEPKEKYSTQRHHIDLEIKKCKQPSLLEVNAQHPWKKGMHERDTLDLQAMQMDPLPSLAEEEVAQLDLETAQKLYTEYGEECDHAAFKKRRMEDFLDRIDDPQFEMTHLSEVLQDSPSQSILQKCTEISFRLADPENYTEREQKRLQSALQSHKKFLKEHLAKKVSLLELHIQQIERKMASLQQHTLQLLQKEKGNIDLKLTEIGSKMADLPEKWKLESQLKLKKELTLQILEGLTKLYESKVIDHQLFHIESKPLDVADAPLEIEPPHLFMYASMGGMIGGFLFGGMILLQAFVKGFPVSEEYLRDRGFKVVTKSFALQSLALELKPGEILALIGCNWAEELQKMFEDRGKTALIQKEIFSNVPQQEIVLWECLESPGSPEALWALAHSSRFLLQLNEEKAENIFPFEKKSGLCVLKR